MNPIDRVKLKSAGRCQILAMFVFLCCACAAAFTLIYEVYWGAGLNVVLAILNAASYQHCSGVVRRILDHNQRHGLWSYVNKHVQP